jgi:hypothetical protein
MKREGTRAASTSRTARTCWAAGACWATMLAALALTSLACRRAPSADVAIAHVTVARGAVEAERAGHWLPAPVGFAVLAGDAIRTGAGASATLTLVNGRQLRLGTRARVRFVVGSPAAGPRVGVELGAVEVEGEGDLSLQTARGPTVLAPRTRMRVAADPSARARYEVLVGRAALGEGDTAVVIEAGEGLMLATGGAELERYKVDLGAALIETTPPKAGGRPVIAPGVAPIADADAGSRAADAAPAPDARPPDVVAATPQIAGAVAAAAMAPSREFDLTIPAGESAILHGPQPPLAVRVRFTRPCAVGGVVESGPAGQAIGRRSQRAAGVASATLLLVRGAHRYRVMCAGAEQGSGQVIVRQDAGTTRVPRTAPLNTIDADGQKYTVLYQNRLPALTLTWPGAPQGKVFTVHVERAGNVRTWPTTSPQLRLAAGALEEGDYTWWWSDAENRQSRLSTLVIRFDNAAVTAQVQAPAEGAALAGAQDIDVAGIALAGSTVAVGGQALAVDDQGRFRGRVKRPAAPERAVAIRLEHARSGVHYYVRRLAP